MNAIVIMKAIFKIDMKNHLTDLGAGFLAGFLVASAATIIGSLGSALSFWSSLIVLDVAIFFAYAQFPFAKERLKHAPSLAIAFLLFTAGAILSGILLAYYIVYLFEHGHGFFL